MTTSRFVWTAGGVLAGLVIGLNLAGLWPQVPVHAVATHGEATMAMCTGPVDQANEAVYVLDFVSGDLYGWVMNITQRKFLANFKHNVKADFGPKASKYLMVTGLTDVRGSGSVRPGQAVVYVAEVTSGRLIAYGVPWQPQLHNAGRTQTAQLLRLDGIPFRDASLQPDE